MPKKNEDSLKKMFKDPNVDEDMIRDYLKVVRHLLDVQGTLIDDEFENIEGYVDTRLSNSIGKNSKFLVLRRLDRLYSETKSLEDKIISNKDKIEEEKRLIKTTAAEYDKNKKSELNEKLSDEDLVKRILKALSE